MIAAAVYSFKWIQNINNFQDPTENGFVKALLDEAKRSRSKPAKRKDIINSELLTLKAPITTIVVCFVFCLWF